MQLSPHFSLEEMTRSNTAEARGIDNSPAAAQVANLERLAGVLETLRAVLGVPIVISSAFRCPALNRAVGGVANSAHVSGLAVDLTAPQCGTPLDVAHVIAASGIEFDQVIHEFGRWVHLGLSEDAQRGQLLTIDKHGTRSGLLPVRT